jgi:hypothetical protein
MNRKNFVYKIRYSTVNEDRFGPCTYDNKMIAELVASSLRSSLGDSHKIDVVEFKKFEVIEGGKNDV